MANPVPGALGARPLRALFDLPRGPASAVRTAGARWAALLVVAVNGKYSDVPDNPDVRARLRKGANQYARLSWAFSLRSAAGSAFVGGQPVAALADIGLGLPDPAAQGLVRGQPWSMFL